MGINLVLLSCTVLHQHALGYDSKLSLAGKFLLITISINVK